MTIKAEYLVIDRNDHVYGRRLNLLTAKIILAFELMKDPTNSKNVKIISDYDRGISFSRG